MNASQKSSLSIPAAKKSLEEPFQIIYNYRKTKMLKKARELRKHKMELLKR